MKINLTKLRELANKTGEGEDHVQKIRNAQEFVYSISPMLIVDLIDEIERLRGALEFYGSEDNWNVSEGTCHGTATKWGQVYLCLDLGNNARVALETHREGFEE